MNKEKKLFAMFLLLIGVYGLATLCYMGYRLSVPSTSAPSKKNKSVFLYYKKVPFFANAVQEGNSCNIVRLKNVEDHCTVWADTLYKQFDGTLVVSYINRIYVSKDTCTHDIVLDLRKIADYPEKISSINYNGNRFYYLQSPDCVIRRSTGRRIIMK